MCFKKITGIFYIVYTVYILLVCSITDITVLYVLPAIFAIWLSYFLFTCGIKLSLQLRFAPLKLQLPSYPSLNEAEKHLLWSVSIALSIVFGVFVVRFYTGMSPSVMFSNLFSGESNYYSYQRYFADHVSKASTFSKAPYILMCAFNKALMVFGVSYWCSFKKLHAHNLLMAGLCSLAHFYFSLGRGTNFEIYEFAILAVYIFLKRTNVELSLDRFSSKAVKPLVACFIAGLCFVAIYYLVLDARGFSPQVNISENFSYNPDSLLAQVSPALSLLILNLFGYLGFGLYYIASFIQKVWITSPLNFLAAFFPFGYQLTAGMSTSDIMSETISVGVMWHPDFINVINSFGIVGLVIIFLLLGFICGKLEAKKGNLLGHMLGYLLLLQMLSFPIGNFIVASSSNKLLLASLVLAISIKPNTSHL